MLPTPSGLGTVARRMQFAPTWNEMMNALVDCATPEHLRSAVGDHFEFQFRRIALGGDSRNMRAQIETLLRNPTARGKIKQLVKDHIVLRTSSRCLLIYGGSSIAGRARNGCARSLFGKS